MADQAGGSGAAIRVPAELFPSHRVHASKSGCPRILTTNCNYKTSIPTCDFQALLMGISWITTFEISSRGRPISVLHNIKNTLTARILDEKAKQENHLTRNTVPSVVTLRFWVVLMNMSWGLFCFVKLKVGIIFYLKIY